MWQAHGPEWIDEGERDGYFWFQSSYFLVEEFVAVCPELLRGKWAIMTSFDCQYLLPFKESRGTDPRLWVGEPKLISDLSDVPWSGNGDEFYIFDGAPSTESLSVVYDTNSLFGNRFDYYKEESKKDYDEFWKVLVASGASAYFVRSQSGFLALKDRELTQRFKRSEFVREYKTIYVEKNRAALRAWLASETADQPCVISDCNQLRIKLASNCARHHFEMLYGQRFPDEMLE